MGRHHGKGVGRRENVDTHRHECDYHQCRQPIGQIRECPHCKKHFCEYHYPPKPPGVVEISNATYEELQNWRREDAHPCYPFVAYHHQMKQQENDKVKESLDRMRHKVHETPKSPSEFRPRFARLKHKTGMLGERARTCAGILAKLYNLDSHQNYALSEFFYTVVYEARLKGESPGKYNKLLGENYQKMMSSFGSEEYLRIFLRSVAKENQVIIMQVEGEAKEVAHELQDDLDALAELMGEKSLGFVLNGANFYSFRNVVPKEFREWYEKEKSTFYLYHQAAGDDILVGTLPKDFVSYYSQSEYYTRPRTSALAASPTWKKVFWILVLAVFTIGIVMVILNPGVMKKIVLAQADCNNGLNHSQCSSIKPIYCNNGVLEDNSEVCGCEEGNRSWNHICIPKVSCEDGSLSPDCSQNRPYQCLNGILIPKASLCGCPDEYKAQNDTCVQIQRCSDRTVYGECSSTKPKMCDNGNLVDRASVCGCGGDLTPSGDRCVSRYETNAKSMNYPYILRGSRGSIPVTVFGGLRDYLASQPRTFVCYGGVCPSDTEMQLSFVKEPNEQPYISSLANQIMGITQNKDDQARIAVNLVQQIPYDWTAFNSNVIKGKYPYETLYDDTGVCEEKSVLLASLLRDLGFGTALFEFNTQNHMAVGIKCPDQYAYKGTGYCFIEATSPTIITYSNGDYIGVGKLTEQPVVIQVSDGASFSSVLEDYNDANRFTQITNMGPVLDMGTYNEWLLLSNKYGLQTTPGSSSGLAATTGTSNNNRVIESPGTSGVCGHEGEKCCTMLISGESSATLYEICEDGMKCISSRCVRN